MRDRYEIRGELGRGGMGTVYRAYDPELGREVALKVLSSPSRKDLARFRREYATASRLRHPGLARIHDAGSSGGGNRYFVQDLIKGESLQDLLERKTPTASEIARTGAALADALGYLHGHGVWHRDVKPANVIIQDDGCPVLVDLGLVSDSESDLTRTGTAMGTPDYWSPEQALGLTRAVDHRTDVYSLGATLYALATGGPPFVSGCVQGYVIAHAAKEAKPIEGPLGDVIAKAMAKSPQDRYQSARAMAFALRQLDQPSPRLPWYQRLFRRQFATAAPVREIRIVVADRLSRVALATLAANVHQSMGEPVPLDVVIVGPEDEELFRAELGEEFRIDERMGEHSRVWSVS